MPYTTLATKPDFAYVRPAQSNDIDCCYSNYHEHRLGKNDAAH